MQHSDAQNTQHPEQNKRPAKKEKAQGLFNRMKFAEKLEVFYRFAYVCGVQTVRIIKRMGRKTRRFFRPAISLLKAIYARTAEKQVAKLKQELHSISEGFQIAGKRLVEAKKQGTKQTILEGLQVTRKSVARHRSFLMFLMNMVAPIASIALLLGTIHYWNTLNYGLVLKYGGKDIAAIESETVFEKATEMVNQRMVHDTSYEDATVDITPQFQLTVLKNEAYSTPGTVCDLIIKQSDGIIEEASGLYVDGKLLGAIKSSADLRYVLQGILNSVRGNDTEAEAEFYQDVEMVTGLFPTTSIMATDEMKKLLTGTSKDAEVYVVQPGDTATSIAKAHNISLNTLVSINGGQIGDMLHDGDLVNVEVSVPKLSVQLTKKVSSQNALPYKTITQKNDSQYTDYSKVKVEGVNGVQQVVDKVTYLNGSEIKRTRVSATVVSKAVDKVIETGTKKRPKNTGPGVSSGKLMWPVPSLHMITTGFEYRWGSFHSGIDISGGSAYGKTIVAADGGTVVAAGYSGSYGNRVEIRHSNGIKTLYGHCSKLLVSPGQKVSKGQAIALVGSTGNSTGPHCHFEVYKGGTRMNPLNYVSR